jgi:antitoxin component YwqK of YwqJK toxin-antitoxin module
MKLLFEMFLGSLILLLSCSEPQVSSIEIIKPDKAFIDSIKQKSDTSWEKQYRNEEFATAQYFVDKKDSIVTQLMKDANDSTRQISIAKYDKIRLFFAEYYANGQIKATFLFDSLGKYNGPSRSYYQDGRIKSEGNYQHGLLSGSWKNYDENGKLKSTDEYDKNGQLTRTKQ